MLRLEYAKYLIVIQCDGLVAVNNAVKERATYNRLPNSFWVHHELHRDKAILRLHSLKERRLINCWSIIEIKTSNLSSLCKLSECNPLQSGKIRHLGRCKSYCRNKRS